MNTPDFSLDLFLTFASNPLAFIALTVGITEAAQKAWKWLDGPIIVPTFATGLGAIMGAVAGANDLVTVQGFTSGWTSGLLYGALAGLSGVFGLNLIEAISDHTLTKKPEALVNTPADTAAQWLVDYTSSLVPRNKLTAALDLIAPLLSRFVDERLTPELQADLTRRVHKILAGAKLIPERDFKGDA